MYLYIFLILLSLCIIFTLQSFCALTICCVSSITVTYNIFDKQKNMYYNYFYHKFFLGGLFMKAYTQRIICIVSLLIFITSFILFMRTDFSPYIFAITTIISTLLFVVTFFELKNDEQKK